MNALPALPSASAVPACPEPRVEWRARAADIAPELWERCFPPPLEGRWIYEPLESGCEAGQFDFAYGVVRRGEEVLAIVPSFTTSLPVSLVAPELVDRLLRLGGPLLRPLRFPRVLFIGSPCADEGGLGLAPGADGDEVAVAVQVAAWERAKALRCVMMTWKDVPERDAAALRALARRAGLVEAASYPGTLIDPLPDSFEAYLARLSVKQRHNLRRKLRLSRESIALEGEVVIGPDEALVDDIWRLFSNTYAKSDIRFERLTRAFWAAMARHPDSRFIVLRRRDTGRVVAFMLAVLRGRRAINKFLGIDYGEGPKAYLYFRLWEEFVRFASGAGADSAQSGQTSYRAKLDLGHALVPLANFFRYRNPLVHKIAAEVAKRISWASLDQDLKEHLDHVAARRGDRPADEGCGPISR
jgi:hypothetical protein